LLFTDPKGVCNVTNPAKKQIRQRNLAPKCSSRGLCASSMTKAFRSYWRWNICTFCDPDVLHDLSMLRLSRNNLPCPLHYCPAVTDASHAVINRLQTTEVRGSTVCSICREIKLTPPTQPQRHPDDSRRQRSQSHFEVTRSIHASTIVSFVLFHHQAPRSGPPRRAVSPAQRSFPSRPGRRPKDVTSHNT
jgi:hypothetical protein